MNRLTENIFDIFRAMFGCVTAEIDPIYQHLVGARHRTKYDILVHTFPDSEEEISARKFPIPIFILAFLSSSSLA